MNLENRLLEGKGGVDDWHKFAIMEISHKYDKQYINARHNTWNL